MGKFANSVQNYLCQSLSEAYSPEQWKTEYTIGGTPVDIGGQVDGTLYLIELEWRRADPADNAAKIFRHVSANEIEAAQITMLQIFTNYYELTRGDVSSKRKNAEFVGEVAARSFNRLSYAPVELEIDPPKRGEEWPETWQDAASEAALQIRSHIESGGN